MTTAQPEPGSACPVHEFTPYELKPLGAWTAFYDQLRAEAPVVRNLFGRSYLIPTRHEDILAVLQDPETIGPAPAARGWPHAATPGGAG